MHLTEKFIRFMGMERSSISGTEQVVSAMGGFLGISLIAAISFQFTGAQATALLVPSMGASAVLLFAVPHGKLSQPWPLIGGNLISALIGVSCYKIIPDPFIASGMAVGIAILAMHLLNCIHPPGGATALVAVIGGPAIHELGYYYVITPILLNVIIIFLVAFIFNSLFPWRRYPASTMRFANTPQTQNSFEKQPIDTVFIENAIKDMDLIVDVTTEDLQQLIELTLQHSDMQLMKPEQILLGHYYTNGKQGAEWSVRQIIDESHSTNNIDMVIYRIVEGRGLRSADSCTREEFSKWSAREVFPHK